MGAVLSQKSPDNDDLPIAYASRCLNPAERNYSTIEKELLAIVWSTKNFRPLVWLTSLKNPSSRLTRWRLELADFQFSVTYKPGKYNVNADALSRVVLDNPSNTNVLIVTRETRKNSINPIFTPNVLITTRNHENY